MEFVSHYKKIKLSKDISLRYFYSFQARKYLVGKWALKSHSDRKYSIIDNIGVELILRLHNKDINDFIEIRNKLTNNGFEKMKIKNDGTIKVKIEKPSQEVQDKINKEQ